MGDDQRKQLEAKKKQMIELRNKERQEQFTKMKNQNVMSNDEFDRVMGNLESDMDRERAKEGMERTGMGFFKGGVQEESLINDNYDGLSMATEDKPGDNEKP